MFTIERTANELRRRLIDNHFEPITITMKCNGDPVRITPCSNSSDAIASIDDIVYYLVESPSLPWLGSEKIETIAKELNEYQQLLGQKEDDKVRLDNIRKRLQLAHTVKLPPEEIEKWEELFSFYSDYHKDVYGYRPRDIHRPAYMCS